MTRLVTAPAVSLVCELDPEAEPMELLFIHQIRNLFNLSCRDCTETHRKDVDAMEPSEPRQERVGHFGVCRCFLSSVSALEILKHC